MINASLNSNLLEDFKQNGFLVLDEFIDLQYLEKLRERIEQWNKIKYGNDSNRIIICTLKPQGTVTTAPKDK